MNAGAMAKAVVAILGGVLALVEAVGWVRFENHAHLLETASAILTPIFVYLVPNKAA